MKITFFDTHHFERDIFQSFSQKLNLSIDFLDFRLTEQTASIAKGSPVVCSFVNDKVNESCLKVLSENNVKLLVLRSAGFNHVDLEAAKKFNILVARVPGYSPYAVAEYAVALLLTLNRKIHRAYSRVRELNFSLDGLVGFDLHGKTIGVVGTGRIGKIFAQIMTAFGCKVLAVDLQKDPDLEAHPGVTYTDLLTLCRQSDMISLHVPLNPKTHHMIDAQMISEMKPGIFIVNTGRGALIDAKALLNALKKEKIGAAALDVYEEEEEIFFHDLSDKILKDDILARLLTFPNVLITSHQAFLTKEALGNIAQTTLESVDEYRRTGKVSSAKVVSRS